MPFGVQFFVGSSSTGRNDARFAAAVAVSG
jgi:hypothetical protein